MNDSLKTKAKVLRVISMALGTSLDARVEGEIVSLAATVDGEDVHFLIPQKDWRRIVENADWWRDKLPTTEREVTEREVEVP